jgi:hypothetical protein
MTWKRSHNKALTNIFRYLPRMIFAGHGGCRGVRAGPVVGSHGIDRHAPDARMFIWWARPRKAMSHLHISP